MLRALKRIIDWTGSMKARLFWGCVCSFFMTWAGACPIFIAAWTLGAVAESAKASIPLDPLMPWMALAGIVAAILLRFAFSYGKNRLQESIGTEMAAQDRIEIGERLKRVPLGYFSQVKTGDILATATTELGVLELQGMKMVDAVINGYIAVFAILCFLVVMSPLAALIALVGIGLSALSLWGINRRSARLTPRAHAANERLSGAIVEFVRGLATAKSYGRENTAMGPIAEAIDDLSKKRIDIELAFTPLNVAHLCAIKLASVGVVATAAFAALAGHMEMWVFIALSLFSFTIFAGVENVNDSAHMLGDLDDILNRLQELKSAPCIDGDGRKCRLDNTAIEFDHVDFSYEKDGKQVLHDVCLMIPGGSTCALVGPSGAGKTTVANLMARFYDVDGGSVRVGGRDVRELTCDSLLENFAMVFQNVYLFDDTVAANIGFGRPSATREEIEEAARRACCYDFIMELPQGFDTRVGEGGTALSGGQKQRISIARALLKDAPIIILDEATASVDPENEALIQQAIAELTADKTVVAIAHRLATIRNADQILVIDDGVVAQRGTHDELMGQEGTYRRFVEMREASEGWKISG